MNALRKALADYFAVRRALGFKLYRAEKLLNQFLTFVARSNMGVCPAFRGSPLR